MTAATTASSASQMGWTATSARNTPSTMETTAAVPVPHHAAGTRPSRPVFRRYAIAIATMRKASMPSLSVKTVICSMVVPRICVDSGGQNQLAVLGAPETVFAPFVLDDQFPSTSQQLLAHYPL